MLSNRRRFIALAAAAPFTALVAAQAVAAAATACFDPASLGMSQKRIRTSVQFAAVSPDPAKRCELCAFFKASQPGCGACQILGGPVSAGSLCSSYAAKAK